MTTLASATAIIIQDNDKRLAKPSLLVLNRNFVSSGALVLATNVVGDLFILRLLYSRLVTLIALLEAILLDCINAYNMKIINTP